MPNIRITTSDEKIIEVDIEIMKCSQIITDFLEIYGNIEEDFPLNTIDSNTLKLIIKWATYHKNHPTSANTSRRNEYRTDDIVPWDCEFLKMDQMSLYKLIEAAYLLYIPDLIILTYKGTAKLIENKSAEEIRETFDINNDFTSSEEDSMNDDEFNNETEVEEYQVDFTRQTDYKGDHAMGFKIFPK